LRAVGNVRDWRDIHRYALQFAHLNDGTCICLGNICMPRTMSRCAVFFTCSVYRFICVEAHGGWNCEPYEYKIVIERTWNEFKT